MMLVIYYRHLAGGGEVLRAAAVNRQWVARREVYVHGGGSLTFDA